LSERLKALAAGKLAEEPRPSPAPPAKAGPAAKAAPGAKSPAPGKPAAPGAKAPPSAPAAPASGTALAKDRIAQRLRGEVPGVLGARPPAPPAEPERTRTPYLDDSIFEKLPAKMQKVILAASNEEGVIPVRRVLRTLDGPDLAAQEELVGGFAENTLSVLRQRFIEDPDDIERTIFREPSGDLSLRSGDGEVKVRGKCWEFFFLWRWRRPLGANPRATLQAMFNECFTFELADTTVCKMKVVEPVEFDRGDDAYYMECSLDLGGWCQVRFEAATAFTNGRVFVATLEPRVIRAKDVPAPKTMSPKDFVALLNKNRRRG
ncbi:MAG TPA: hypothetical protein VHF22_01035, partial [Planctomycetota bacterium]|nr:hypothetical protein [Planctomycetota bacterium]